jgi:NDP-mannose synthase
MTNERGSVTAFILAGGRGSRLAPLTTVIPKPLVPVGEAPILEVLIRQLVARGITEIVISLGYLGHLIQAVVGDGQQFGASVTYTREDEPLGTAGALAMLPTIGPGEIVMVLNGDTLTDLDFAALVDEHRSSAADASIVVVTREHNVDFGVIEIDQDGMLRAYIEKPSYTYQVSIGINVFSGSALGELVNGERIDMPDFLLRLKEQGRSVRCVPSQCFWLDLGRIDDLRAAGEIVAREPERFLK